MEPLEGWDEWVHGYGLGTGFETVNFGGRAFWKRKACSGRADRFFIEPGCFLKTLRCGMVGEWYTWVERCHGWEGPRRRVERYYPMKISMLARMRK